MPGHSASAVSYLNGAHPGSVFSPTSVPNVSYIADDYPNRATISYSRDAPPPVAPSNTQSLYAPEKQRVLSSSPIHSSSYTADSGVKAKLPHGLTVHELKAMTKARLQAEASEHVPSLGTSAHNPVPAQPVPEIHDRAPVRSSVVPLQIYSMGAQPPMSISERNHHHETRSLDSRNDLWESGSVSTQTSEYFGSEKGFAPLEDGMYGNRARSFSANAVGQEFRRDSPSPMISQFHDAYVPNRSRAATLSPRAGLSQLYEDHPLTGELNLPGLSTFSSPRADVIAPRSSNPSLESFYSSIYQESNRARTSSAVSMPSLSHTSEEFALDPSLSKFGPANEEITPVTGLSDAFRMNSTLSGFEGLSIGENRSRASTWSATSGGNDLFGPSLLTNAPDPRKEISEELASILEFSGNEDRDVPSDLSSWM
ncbi:hypothetical protein FisN_15Lh058 [Fistulifera solaris]|uniref:Uncharacterized protein n=1 Tax=Fistulifera solaris TaxID=1519565 RepID=A0A1Z5KHJ5_FISSO|nr:hypothetical protein FisN_15Lh058 [Fistulifera solaris]|eukprot:GAX25687.1 hypothetical protein FisN_15Lh058 [Fistulifera solaris]